MNIINKITMKLLYKILAAAAAILALSSCAEEALEPLTGKYEKPVSYELNTLKSQSVEMGESTRTFTVELTDNAATLCMKFVGNKYYLPDNGYTAATADQAKNGFYIVGEGGSTFTVNGKTVNVDSGTLTVKQEEGVYSFSGKLWLADESVIDVKSKVTIVYEPDAVAPTPDYLMVDTVSPSTDANGAPIENLETHTITLFDGEELVAVFSLLRTPGVPIEGTYECQEYAGADGLMGNGFDMSQFGWDMIIGSYYYVDGKVVLINAGETLTVTKHAEGFYEFAGSTGYNFLAATADYEGGASGDYEELSVLISATVNQGLITMNMATEDVSATYDAATYQTIYSGTGYYLATDIYSADGKLHTGTYKACAVGGTVGEGEFGIGYDTTIDWGFGPMEMKDWGTCWWTVDNGATSAEKILDGTIVVALNGDNFSVTIQSSSVNAKFTYPVNQFKDAYGNPIDVVDDASTPEPEPEPEQPDSPATPAPEAPAGYESLTVLASAQSNVANGVTSLTVTMAKADMSNYLSMDIYSADGKLYTGSYEANSVGGVLAEGQFGIGYDTTVDWGWGPMEMKDWGTCWWTVGESGNTAQKVLDGTVEVSIQGEYLVIQIESTVVKAHFACPVADFKDGQGNAIEVAKGAEPIAPEAPAGYESLTVLASAQSNVANGVTSLTVTMAKADMSNYLSMDIYSADGKLYTGSYEANSVGGVLAEGQFGIGYDTTVDWGWGPMEMKDWGTCWWTVGESGNTAQKVLDGNVTVSVERKFLVIKLDSSVVKAHFTCPVADFKDGQGNAIEVI